MTILFFKSYPGHGQWRIFSTAIFSHLFIAWDSMLYFHSDNCCCIKFWKYNWRASEEYRRGKSTWSMKLKWLLEIWQYTSFLSCNVLKREKKYLEEKNKVSEARFWVHVYSKLLLHEIGRSNCHHLLAYITRHKFASGFS